MARGMVRQSRFQVWGDMMESSRLSWGGLFILVFILVSSGLGQEVHFADPNLEGAVRGVLQKPEGPLMPSAA